MVDEAAYPVLFGTTQATWAPIDLRFEFLTGEVDPGRIARVYVVPFIGPSCVVVGFEHGDWGPVGGGREPGESVHAALERELAEEAGGRLLTYTPFAVLRCRSRAPAPYRPHEPHPDYDCLYGYGEVELSARPSSTTAPSARWRSRCWHRMRRFRCLLPRAGHGKPTCTGWRPTGAPPASRRIDRPGAVLTTAPDCASSWPWPPSPGAVSLDQACWAMRRGWLPFPARLSGAWAMMAASRATGLLVHLEGAMKVGLLGTGFGIAHARIYHTHPQVSEVVVFGRTPAKLQAFAGEFGYATTTDLSSIYNDPAVDLVDVCLPTSLHAEHVTRALAAGKHVLCELPLATTMDDAQRIVDAQAASDGQVFVDMFGRFDPATEFLHTAIAQGSYGTLQTLTMELRTALLWEGYQIGLDSMAMDVLHSSLDAIVTALGRPESMTVMGVAKDDGGSAAEVLLGYPSAVVRCSASALLPKPYGMRGGYRAVFTDAAIESSWTAGYDGRPTGTLTEYTEQGQREVDLPARDAYGAVVDHVIACCQGRDASRLSPASVLDTLQLTLEVRTALTAPKRP